MGAHIGIRNRGVSALGASVVRLLYGARPDVQIALLIVNRDSHTIKVRLDDQERELAVVNYRLSPRAKLGEQLWWIVLLALLYRCLPVEGWRRFLAASNRWVGAVARADAVLDIRGGDSFSDIYGVRGFVLGTLAVLSVIWIRGNIVLLPQTYGPYKSWLARSLARYILIRASTILSRDSAGLEVVRQLTRGRRTATLCPDVAFALEAVRPANPLIEPPLAAKTGRMLVGLNVNGLMFNGGYTRNNMFGLRLDYRAFLAQLLRGLLARPDIEVLLVPHTFSAPGRVESDNGACAEIASHLAPDLATRVHQVTEAYDQFHIKGVIGMCDFFIGSRMHACIAALSQGIPAIGVAYSKKFRGVFETVGAEDWIIDGRDMDADQAVQRVLELYAQRDALRTRLATTVPAAQARLYAVFAELLHSGAASAPVGDPALLSAASPEKASTNP